MVAWWLPRGCPCFDRVLPVFCRQVSSSKETRLFNTDGIFYNSTCKIYDAELWPCGPDPLNCWRNSKPPKYAATSE